MLSHGGGKNHNKVTENTVILSKSHGTRISLMNTHCGGDPGPRTDVGMQIHWTGRPSCSTWQDHHIQTEGKISHNGVVEVSCLS